MLYGADADELEAIAKELEGYEHELGQLLREGVGAVSLVGLSATLNAVWRGPRALEFAGLWQARHLVRVRDVQVTLRAAAIDLRKNADEQRKVSSVRSPGDRAPLTKYEEDVLERFKAGTDDLHEDPVAYWNSLDSYDKDILIRHEPDWVLSLLPLGALSPEEVERAREWWKENVFHEMDVVESRVEHYFDAELDVKLWSFGIHGAAGISELRNGDGTSRFVVDFKVEGDIAKAGFGIEAGGYVSYEFDSLEEAQAFQRGLAERLIPDKGDAAYGLVPIIGGGLVVANTAADIKEFADRHADRRTSAKVEAGVKGTVKLDGKDFEAEASLSGGGFYDVETGERGFYVDISAEAEMELGGDFEADGSVAVRGEVVWDRTGEPKELVLDVDLAVAGQLEDLFGEDFALGDEVEGAVGGAASAKLKLDLQNPRNQALADALLRGDMGALRDIAGNAEAVVQVGVTAGVEGDIDFKAGEIEYGRRDYQNVKTYGKAPNSGLEEI